MNNVTEVSESWGPTERVKFQDGKQGRVVQGLIPHRRYSHSASNSNTTMCPRWKVPRVGGEPGSVAVHSDQRLKSSYAKRG